MSNSSITLLYVCFSQFLSFAFLQNVRLNRMKVLHLSVQPTNQFTMCTNHWYVCWMNEWFHLMSISTTHILFIRLPEMRKTRWDSKFPSKIPSYAPTLFFFFLDLNREKLRTLYFSQSGITVYWSLMYRVLWDRILVKMVERAAYHR